MADPGQKYDIAAGHPEVVENLRGEHETERTSLEPATEHIYESPEGALFSIIPPHSRRLLVSKQPYHHLPPFSPLPPLSV